MYRKTFRQVATAAEKSYYNEMFNARKNTVKQLWRNLNEVCSFKGRTRKPTTISKLKVDTCVFTQPKDISNQINNYFATIGEKLVQDLDKNYPVANTFHSYYVLTILKTACSALLSISMN